MTDIEELERRLHGDEQRAGTPDLAAIRRAGRRRRRTRTAIVAGIAAVAIVATAGAVDVWSGGGSDRAVEPASGLDHTELSPVAERALAQIPGAEQLNDWQVSVPAPEGGHLDGFGMDKIGPERIYGDAVALETPWYAGVTSFRDLDFPGWLYRGMLRQEKAMAEGNAVPVGSTDVGVVVEAGSSELACLAPWDWNKNRPLPGKPRSDCAPAVLFVMDGQTYYAWGMGTDDFLRPGSKMELFQVGGVEDQKQTEWIGGMDGTGVDHVVLTSTGGDQRDAEVASGTLVPGETMFWGTVPGDLATATAYDANSEVVEKHEVKPCDDPVDCEVR